MNDILLWFLFCILGGFSGWGACEYFRVNQIEIQRDVYRTLYQAKYGDIIKTYERLRSKGAIK